MHGRFDVPSSIRFAQAVEPFNLLWLEEPTPPENLGALAEVRRNTRTPICAGENLYTRFDFRQLFEKKAADYVTPDVAKCGGLTEAKRIANMAELDYLPSPHTTSRAPSAPSPQPTSAPRSRTSQSSNGTQI